MPENTPQTAALPDFLITYLLERDDQRANAVNAFLASLTDRERGLFHDAAVMGYVQGLMRPREEGAPKDSQVMSLVIDACFAFPDLYPAVNAEPFTPAELAAAEADVAALEAEFPSEADEEKYPASIGIYCDRCGTSAERDYVVSDRMNRQQRFAAARRHLNANEGWQCDGTGDLCPKCVASAAAEGAQR